MSILKPTSVTSQLRRPFDPREYNSPNCSKTERHGVRKGREVFDLSFFCPHSPGSVSRWRFGFLLVDIGGGGGCGASVLWTEGVEGDTSMKKYA